MRVLLAVFAATLVVSSGNAQTARFSSAVEDLPLMAELSEERVAPFETPQGRIVRVETRGRVTPEAVTEFYNTTLPALGWRRSDEGAELAYLRSSERLSVKIDRGAFGATRVIFLLTPAGAPAL